MLFVGYLGQKCLVFLSWNEHAKKMFIVKVNKSLFQRNGVQLSPPQLYIKLCPIGCCGGAVPRLWGGFFWWGTGSQKMTKQKAPKRRDKKSGSEVSQEVRTWNFGTFSQVCPSILHLSLNMKVWRNLSVFIMKSQKFLKRISAPLLSVESEWSVIMGCCCVHAR